MSSNLRTRLKRLERDAQTLSVPAGGLICVVGEDESVEEAAHAHMRKNPQVEEYLRRKPDLGLVLLSHNGVFAMHLKKDLTT